MVEIVISVAAKIAEYLVAPVGRQFRYLWNYKTNLENLKNEVEKLEAKRDTVQLSIKPGEDPMPEVKLWQERANRIIIEIPEIVEDNPEQANIQCFKGFSCPNLRKRYQRSKKAAKKLKDVLILEQEAAPFLREVAYPIIPEQTALQPSKEYVAFESRKSILKDIIDTLCDPDVNMIGIYGMGGAGKTTLAKKVAPEAKQHNLFDKIVFVEVSESPDIPNIQRVIADNLGLQFKEKIPVTGRANRLHDRLKKVGKILLILDNIWGRIDFEEVGIPFENDHKGLKLLLTTRSRDLLTNEMKSQHNFEVHTLNEADAWSLFKKTVGTCVDDHPDLQSIAREIAMECGGMPLAIVAIANALKDKKAMSTWSTALDELKNPTWENFEGKRTKQVYTSIKVSYECLDSEDLKKVFLLCSRMGCTYDASIRDLFRYGLGLGFFKKLKTLEKAQCKVKDLVQQLKDNSLLLDAPIETGESHWYGIPDSERFAMHDIICDVARSIDDEKGNVCNVIDDGFSCFWAKKNILKSCTSITLHNIGKLPKDLKLVLPQLEFFYMKSKDSFSRIIDDFFAEMSSLLVLHLIEMNLSPLPTSLSHLVNLHTLCLEECKLGDIADIGKLEKLEILSFHGSKIKKLPEEMCQLTSIRLLDLTSCSTLEIIPPGVLSCFTQLEALYMYNTSIKWEVGGLDTGRENARLNELKHLCDSLTTLEICIPNVKMSEGLLSSKLKRYKISIDDCYWNLPPRNSRTLRVKLNTNDNADEVISQLKGIKQLELVEGRRDDFIDSKQSVTLDALESLSLRDLNFEKICNVPLAAESFCQLRTITVLSCDKLTNIFSFSVDRVLPKLQEIRVYCCANMEGIFAIEREEDVNNSELIHEIQFSQLCSVTLKDLPKLKSFCHRVKTTSQLQLTSSTNDGEIISEDMIDIPKSLFNKKVGDLTNLNHLVLEHCDNLKELFSSSMVNSFVQLRYLEIPFCSLLEDVVFMEKLKEEERKDIQFPFLKEMKITHCLNFKGFISNGKIGFPSLKEMEICWCPKFKEFIFNDKVAVPNIEELTIWGIENLEKIWHNQLVNDSFCKLKSLRVGSCEKLLNVFPSNIYERLLSLESLEVSMCDSLEEIFDPSDCGIHGTDEEGQMQQPSFFSLVEEIGFPSLKEMEISRCPKLKEFIFNDKVAVPNLEKLTISGMHSLEKIWHNQLVNDSFCKLKSLKVECCKKLLNVFPSNICGRLLSLESLEVSLCYSLEEIFDLSDCGIHGTDEEGQMQQPSFFSLVEEIGFPSLKEMKIESCPKLKEFIFNDKVAVPNLEKLTISSMDNLEKIWHNQLVNDSFCKLKSLEVEYCKKLLNVFPSNICGRLLSLESLEVSWCDSLEEIFDLSDCGIHGTDEEGQMQQPSFFSLVEEIGFPSLKEMEIRSCPKLKEFIFNDKVVVHNIEKLTISRMDNLKKIWHDQLVTDSFCKLKSLEVCDCKELLNVFPSNICGKLLNLESLEVSRCFFLEEIFDLRESSIYDSQIMLSNLQKLRVSKCQNLKNLFSASILAKEGVVMEEAPARFLFPKLTSLELYRLPELRSFYPGRHKVEGPVLKKLELFDCGIDDTDEDDEDDEEEEEGHDTDEKGQMQQPFFLSLVEQAFPCLEELDLGGEVTMLCQGQFLESLFDSLKILRVYNGHESIFPFGIIQRCQNLEELSLSESHYKEIFPHGEDQTQTKIKTLNLSELYELKYIWKQNSKLDLIIQHLEVLKVESCDSLISLTQPPTSFQNPSTSFQNLTSLEVHHCDSEINIGTSTVAKSLVQLTEMSIRLCKKITEVIGYHGDVIEDEVIFRKLKSLYLQNLPSLTSFCSWNFTLKFPSLETLTVLRCPNMKIFSRGDLTTEKLQEVEIHWESVELRPDFNLNTAIQQSYEKANSAKDNGASSSHHFEIDQESIQQFDEEANEDYSASSSDHSE